MTKPIAIWLTDTHLSESTVDINTSIFRQVFDLCESVGVKTIFHGGDIFSSRKGQTEEVLCAFKDIIDEAAQRGLVIYAIAGNHDKTNLTSDRSFLYAFDKHPAFQVMHVGDSIENNLVDIFFLPYFDETLAYQDKLRQVSQLTKKGRCNILLTHVGISEALTNVGIKVENELDKKLFKSFTHVLIGHYHDRQVLEEDRIIYTGSAYQANFGEDTRKGVVVISDDPIDPLSFIDLAFPEYITVDILPDDLDATLVSQITDKSKEAKIRLRIAGDVPEDKKHLVAGLQNSGTKVEIEKSSFSPSEVAQSKTIVMSDVNIVTNFDQWSKDRKIKDVKYGKKLLTEAI